VYIPIIHITHSPNFMQKETIVKSNTQELNKLDNVNVLEVGASADTSDAPSVSGSSSTPVSEVYAEITEGSESTGNSNTTLSEDKSEINIPKANYIITAGSIKSGIIEHKKIMLMLKISLPLFILFSIFTFAVIRGETPSLSVIPGFFAFISFVTAQTAAEYIGNGSLLNKYHDALKDYPEGLTVFDIANKFGDSPSDVYDQLLKLEQNGYVRNVYWLNKSEYYPKSMVLKTPQYMIGLSGNNSPISDSDSDITENGNAVNNETGADVITGDVSEASDALNSKSETASGIETDALISYELQEFISEIEAYKKTLRDYKDKIFDFSISPLINETLNLISLITDRVEFEKTLPYEIRGIGASHLEKIENLLYSYSNLSRKSGFDNKVMNEKEKIKEEIKEINSGLSDILDKMYKEMANDISSDITILETMLNQDGFGKNPLDLK